MSLRIGILTAGGDCPGINAVIRAVVRRATTKDAQVLGIKNGWLGLVEGDIEPLTRSSVRGILPRGGTILGTSRLNPLQSAESLERIGSHRKKYEVDALIADGRGRTLPT